MTVPFPKNTGTCEQHVCCFKSQRHNSYTNRNSNFSNSDISPLHDDRKTQENVPKSGHLNLSISEVPVTSNAHATVEIWSRRANVNYPSNHYNKHTAHRHYKNAENITTVSNEDISSTTDYTHHDHYDRHPEFHGSLETAAQS